MNSEVGICKFSFWEGLKLEIWKSVKRFMKRIIQLTKMERKKMASLRDEFERFLRDSW